MFPVDGLAPKPVVGNLEVPSRTDRREESFFGTSTIGSSTSPKVETGIRNTLWGVKYDKTAVTIQPTNGTPIKLIEQPSIRELSVCLDRYMLPVLVYVYGGDTYIRYYDFATKRYMVTNLSGLEKTGEINSPRLTFDDRRVKFRNSGSVVLGYYVGNKLMIRSSDDNYLSSRIIRTEPTTENYLEQIAMGDNNRLHFVTYTLVDPT